jgi:hypothetical protein
VLQVSDLSGFGRRNGRGHFCVLQTSSLQLDAARNTHAWEK